MGIIMKTPNVRLLHLFLHWWLPWAMSQICPSGRHLYHWNMGTADPGIRTRRCWIPSPTFTSNGLNREYYPSVLEYQIYQHELCRGCNTFLRRVLIYLIFQDTGVRFYVSPNIILKSIKKINGISSKIFYSEAAVHLHCDIITMLWRHNGSDDIIKYLGQTISTVLTSQW
jgi:hypothetical protein